MHANIDKDMSQERSQEFFLGGAKKIFKGSNFFRGGAKNFFK